VSEESLTSPATQYRETVLQVKRHKQQYQSTEATKINAINANTCKKTQKIPKSTIILWGD